MKIAACECQHPCRYQICIIQVFVKPTIISQTRRVRPLGLQYLHTACSPCRFYTGNRVDAVVESNSRRRVVARCSAIFGHEASSRDAPRKNTWGFVRVECQVDVCKEESLFLRPLYPTSRESFFLAWWICARKEKLGCINQIFDVNHERTGNSGRNYRDSIRARRISQSTTAGDHSGEPRNLVNSSRIPVTRGFLARSHLIGHSARPSELVLFSCRR